MSKTLMILFPGKKPDTGHVCYAGGCPLYTEWCRDGQPSICETLWTHPPKEKEGQLACMCNFYNTMNPTIVEADGVDIPEVIRRVRDNVSMAGIAALEAYPPKFVEPRRKARRVQSRKVDTHAPARAIYRKGMADAIEKAARWIMTPGNYEKARFRITDEEFIEEFRKEMEGAL